MRLYCFLLIYIMSGLAVVADSISLSDARQTAAGFLLTARNDGRRPARRAIRETAGALRLRARSRSYYLFDDAQGRFAAVAADDRLPQILAYRTDSLPPQGDARPPLPEGLLDLFAAYDRALLHYGTGRIRTAASYTGPAIPPLATAIRHQEKPYNNYCPYYRNADGTLSEERCVVGCVATALETVLSYHRRVYTLLDTLKGWTTEHYDIPDIAPGLSVDTRLILHDYDREPYTAEQADAVARLSYLLGVAVRMNWSPGSSGANVSNAAEPLRRAFGLGYVHYADSYKYRPDDWLAMLRAELSAGRPVVYAGAAMRMNGHAFVLDGLDEEGLFHVNWGTAGDYDGYFRLDLLNPSEPLYDQTEQGALEGFFCNQEALLLHPDTQPGTVLPDTLARTGRELVADSLVFDLAPEAGKVTPLRLFVRNAAAVALTTPLELFTNAPSDTALLRQADFGALTGVTLQPGESRMLRLFATFWQPGERVLRLSPDDRTIIYERPVTVLPGSGVDLVFGEPAASFPERGTAEIVLPVTNHAADGRAGQRIVYELFEGEPREGHNGICHAAHCFLPGGETMTDTVRFRGLIPGQAYTLLVRSPWTVRHTLRFTLPSETGISHAPADAPDASGSPRHDLSGRRLAPSVRPPRSTVVVSRGRKYLSE